MHTYNVTDVEKVENYIKMIVVIKLFGGASHKVNCH